MRSAEAHGGGDVGFGEGVEDSDGRRDGAEGERCLDDGGDGVVGGGGGGVDWEVWVGCCEWN